MSREVGKPTSATGLWSLFLALLLHNISLRRRLRRQTRNDMSVYTFNSKITVCKHVSDHSSKHSTSVYPQVCSLTAARHTTESDSVSSPISVNTLGPTPLPFVVVFVQVWYMFIALTQGFYMSILHQTRQVEPQWWNLSYNSHIVNTSDPWYFETSILV